MQVVKPKAAPNVGVAAQAPGMMRSGHPQSHKHRASAKKMPRRGTGDTDFQRRNSLGAADPPGRGLPPLGGHELGTSKRAGHSGARPDRPSSASRRRWGGSAPKG